MNEQRSDEQREVAMGGFRVDGQPLEHQPDAVTVTEAANEPKDHPGFGVPMHGIEAPADGSISEPISNGDLQPGQLYKTRTRLRWWNGGIHGTRMRVEPGTVVEFDEKDFEQPGGLVSLQDALDRGLIVAYDESHAGNPDRMSRDEMLSLLVELNEPGPDGNPWPHNVPEDELRDAVKAILDRRMNAEG